MVDERHDDIAVEAVGKAGRSVRQLASDLARVEVLLNRLEGAYPVADSAVAREASQATASLRGDYEGTKTDHGKRLGEAESSLRVYSGQHDALRKEYQATRDDHGARLRTLEASVTTQGQEAAAYRQTNDDRVGALRTDLETEQKDRRALGTDVSKAKDDLVKAYGDHLRTASEVFDAARAELTRNVTEAETRLKNPDFQLLAAGFGIKSAKVKDLSSARKAIAAARKYKGPYLIEFIVEAEENVFPMIPAGAGIDEMVVSIEDLKTK